MGTIVLDTDVVLSDPDVLAHKARLVKLLIPQAALDELRSTPRSRGKAYVQLIQSAMREGTLRKLEDELPGSNGAGPRGRQPRLSVLDGALLLPPHYNVALATTDPLLRAQAKDRNVRTLDLPGLRAELQNVPRSEAVRRDVARLQNGNAAYLAGTLIMGVVAGAVMSEALHNPQLVAELLRHTAAYLLVPSAAVAFFWFRARFRLPYGFAEFISGGDRGAAAGDPGAERQDAGAAVPYRRVRDGARAGQHRERAGAHALGTQVAVVVPGEAPAMMKDDIEPTVRSTDPEPSPSPASNPYHSRHWSAVSGDAGHWRQRV
jgi:hypothetical protein